jgi:hypothetical protein
MEALSGEEDIAATPLQSLSAERPGTEEADRRQRADQSNINKITIELVGLRRL